MTANVGRVLTERRRSNAAGPHHARTPRACTRCGEPTAPRAALCDECRDELDSREGF